MNLFLKIENLYQRYLIFINIQLRYELKFKNLLIYQQNFYTCQDFKHMHALIVSALRLHLFSVTKLAPPENALSTGTLVALLIIKRIY